MRPRRSPHFDLTPREAVVEQLTLRGLVETEDRHRPFKTVAGADVALANEVGRGHAAVVVYSLPDLEEVERVMSSGRLTFPYVPGLLSFREGPLLLRAFEKLRLRPDVLLFDGQGLAHPRRFGLASHLGVLFDIPTIGVGKSRLCGGHREPGVRRGAWAPLVDDEETIGAVLRTRDRVRPVYVSIGHRISLETAISTVLASHDGTRVPKPTREADRLVTERKRASRS